MAKAIRFCKALGMKHFILNGYAIQVVKALWTRGLDTSCFGSLIEDAKKLLTQNAVWQMWYVKKEANMVAHHLGKAAITKVLEIIDLDIVDQCIFSLVLVESQHLST